MHPISVVAAVSLGKDQRSLRLFAALVLTFAVAGCETSHGSSLSSRSASPSAGSPSTVTTSPATSAAPASSAAPSPRLSPSAPGVSPLQSLTPTPAGPPLSSAPATPTMTPTPVSKVVAAFTGTDIVHLPTANHVVALTFDAGANADAIPEILATLHGENVPGTFFFTGDWVRHFPAQARAVGALYPIGNHSNTHPHLPQLSPAEVAAQITDAQVAITAATGRDPRPLFRFPFGSRDTPTRAVVNGLGYVSVFWTVDTLGWQGTSGGQTTSTVTARVLASLQPGEIVLMHVGSNPKDRSTLDGDALRGIIDAIKAHGYGFVTVPQGLGLG